MGKGLETGSAFLQGIRSKITDPEQLAAFDRVIANPTVVTEIGNGVEGQSAIDRQLQTLRDQQATLDARAAEVEARDAQLNGYKDQLDTWWGANQTLVEEARVLKAGRTPTGEKPAPTAGLTDAKLGEVLQAERAAFLGFSRDQNQLTREHFTRFGEILDLEPLLKHPEIAQRGLLGVYDVVHKDRLAQAAADAQKKHDDQVAADAVRKHQEAQAQMPYMAPTGSGSGSPLDALTPAKQPVVDAAVAHYNRLQMERAGAAGT